MGTIRGGWEARFWHVGEPKVSGARSVLLAPHPRGLAQELKKREHKNGKHKQAMGGDWLCGHWSILV